MDFSSISHSAHVVVCMQFFNNKVKATGRVFPLYFCVEILIFLNLQPLDAFCQPRIYNSKRFADYAFPGANSTIE